MVKAGTRFERTVEKMDMIKILKILNGYLKNKPEKTSLLGFIDVCKKAFTINPKVFQHILEVKYKPNARIHDLICKKCLKN